MYAERIFVMEDHLNSPFQFRLRKVRPSSIKKESTINSITLNSSIPTTIGRVIMDDVNTKMLSRKTPLMISRRHATVTLNNGRVFVTDHESLNGVYIRNKRIKPGIKTEVRNGDRVAFGCGVGNAPPEFDYMLEVLPPSISRQTVSFSDEKLLKSPIKRKFSDEPPSLTIIESNTAQILEQEHKIKKLSESLREKEQAHEKLISQLQATESDMLKKLEEQKLELQGEREKAELHLKSLLQQELNQKETRLRSEFDIQIRDLEIEKDLVEKNLQQELSKKLSEKDEAYQKELEQQKIELEETISDKESERQKLLDELVVKESLIQKYKCVEENQKMLESCLEELRKEINEKDNLLKKQKEFTEKVASDAKQTVIQTMEDEFTCIICQELFIEATTLPCAHTFCELCLKLWLKKKKNCPVCRRRIKGKAVRSIVLDSVVDKMLESLSEDDRKRRLELCKEREIEKKKEDSTEDTEGIRELFYRYDEEDDETTTNSRSNERNFNGGQNRDARNLGRRGENYRRRSRSRSPRGHRNRAHQDNGNGRYAQNNGGGSYHYPNMNIAPYMANHVNNNRYSHQDRSGGNFHNYFTHGFHSHLTNQYASHNNNLRCYNCGGLDHIARYCPRSQR